MHDGVYCGPYYSALKSKPHYKYAHNIYHKQCSIHVMKHEEDYMKKIYMIILIKEEEEVKATCFSKW